MLGGYRRAEILFFGGQVTVLLVLLAVQLLPGAVILSVLLLAQLLVKTKFAGAADFLPRVQAYLDISVLIAGLSLGMLA